MENQHIKRKTAIKILFVFWIILAANRLMAQTTVNYNHYADNLTPINPAYSLLDKAGSVNVLGRKQFLGVDGAPSTFLFSGSASVPGIQATAGLFVLNDQYGVTHQTDINAFFAKAIRLNEGAYLAASINAGLRSYTANYTELDATDQKFSTDTRETLPNVGLGVMYYTDSYYIGISVPQLHLRSNTGGADYLNSNYYLSCAFITGINDDIKVKPATLVAYQSGSPAIVNLSAMFLLKDMFGIGANYSTSKQLAGMLSVQSSGFRLGYSYEFGTSSTNLAGFNNSTSEISLNYRFGKNGAGKLL